MQIYDNTSPGERHALSSSGPLRNHIFCLPSGMVLFFASRKLSPSLLVPIDCSQQADNAAQKVNTSEVDAVCGALS